MYGYFWVWVVCFFCLSLLLGFGGVEVVVAGLFRVFLLLFGEGNDGVWV